MNPNPLAEVPPRTPGWELGQATDLIAPDGSRRRAVLAADAQTALWCEVVLSHQHGLMEVVRATREDDGRLRMRSRRDPAGYVEAESHGRVGAIAAKARGRGEEVFCCPVPKTAPVPGREAAAAGAVLWVDIDDVDEAEGRERLAALRPHLICHSGGGLHAYWRLAQPVDTDQLEALNRRLCALTNGDGACVDRGRIMRLAGSYNARRQRWCRVLVADRARPPVDPNRLADRIEDPDPPRPPAKRTARALDDPLALIPPPEYFQSLAGVAVESAGGQVCCPLPDHDDRYASCHVWAQPGRGWWCFGCNRGGAAVDLASLLDGGAWGRDLAGEAFAEQHRRASYALGTVGRLAAVGSRLSEGG